MFFFFLMIRRPPRSTQSRSSAASDVYKRQLRATASNKAAFEADKARLEAENLERRKEAEAVAAKMGDLKVVMVRAAGESGQLYGSVSSRDIADAVTEAGVAISRNQVVLDRAIKTLGLHDVVIRLHPEVTKIVVVNIARSEAEAETQFSTCLLYTSPSPRDRTRSRMPSSA
eukprot:TRINITY_DN27095_c0_g1_i1.p1 TRINITY_DN27095_c0_g1~~TRINITY_DN27095_c0_g1_i1.p1  ORF type:complete len:172 (-),score=84.03 TRINITY_DN27095_c0_g1_i1:142-657(-)